ncbi:MAG TPA: PfkB family carbohydrate kinase, partial [Allosphingosinicella sp.]|nr:PfkB family carbohydrate kinase [Allosphingosinicella sp.]
QLWERWDSDPQATLTALVEKADILFGNHRDISLLLDRDFSGEGETRRREAAQAMFDRFPGLDLIASTARHVTDADTHRIAARVDGRDGAAQTDEVVVAGIVDRIGAGDAFAAGILHGIRTGLDLDATVKSGLALTCLKHSLAGDASLFGQRDIEAFLAGELDVRR